MPPFARAGDWEQPGGRGVEAMGERVRALRRSAGLSQAELAGGRFSKEYVSQIERERHGPRRRRSRGSPSGSTRTAPSSSTASAGRTANASTPRSATPKTCLPSGVTTMRACVRGRPRFLGPTISQPAALRLLRGDAWARIRTGDLEGASALLEQAASLALGAVFDVDRADVVFEIGVLRYSESRIGDAITLLDQALVLAESSALPTIGSCRTSSTGALAVIGDSGTGLPPRRHRACPRARRGLCRRTAHADALFQSSLVAQRQGRWLFARAQAERAHLFDELGDQATVARLLNNLAGLVHLLGDPDQAVALLDDAFEMFVELDLPVDAGYVCSSLAEIRSSRASRAERAQARRRSTFRRAGRPPPGSGDRSAHAGRALTAQGRLDEADSWIARADATFEQARSASHRSNAWIAKADVESRRGTTPSRRGCTAEPPVRSRSRA